MILFDYRSLFQDREQAGVRLAEALSEYRSQEDVVVLALPRGGVPVAYEIARRLGAELDVFVVRKLGVPDQEELAMGAIASGGVRVLNEDVLDAVPSLRERLESVTARERRELERREKAYRQDRPEVRLEGKTVILVDDGLATGSTMRAAIRALRAQKASFVVVAVPVGPQETCQILEQEVDRLVCLEQPAPFSAIGLWYEDFGQTSDAEVRELLERFDQERVPTIAE